MQTYCYGIANYYADNAKQITDGEEKSQMIEIAKNRIIRYIESSAANIDSDEKKYKVKLQYDTSKMYGLNRTEYKDLKAVASKSQGFAKVKKESILSKILSIFKSKPKALPNVEEHIKQNPSYSTNNNFEKNNETAEKFFKIMYPDYDTLSQEQKEIANKDKNFIKDNLIDIKKYYDSYKEPGGLSTELGLGDRETLKYSIRLVESDIYFYILHPDYASLSKDEQRKLNREKYLIDERLNDIKHNINNYNALGRKDLNTQDIIKSTIYSQRKPKLQQSVEKQEAIEEQQVAEKQEDIAKHQQPTEKQKIVIEHQKPDEYYEIYQETENDNGPEIDDR